MKNFIGKALPFALLLSAIAVTGSALAKDSVSQDILEARQETQIWTTYALSPYLRSNDIQVSVDNGTATLTGGVAEDIDKDLAKQIALGVEGIKSVDNKITVNAEQKPKSDAQLDQSYGQYIDDASITAAVKSKLLWSKNSDGLATNVITKFGKVTLTGHSDSATAKELAGRLAKNTRGVKSVNNQLIVKEQRTTPMLESGKAIAAKSGTTVSDSWITTKVKSTYIYSSNVDSSDISVTTKEGLVTLTGKVSSGAERELAIELAQNIRGVKRVQTEELTFK
ncbi:BON domain-containing protein [Simiduia aestuariiviva]|uniref:Osmotically-inducible protein OsmY n=1 Tax=Simiduia aestuariiviva TaxID=1510459 RepID=A0A839UUG3_9GAMM|nr:BON domain-containing protein [Simiduia aestuariiviva]MBB3169017.1 osmotically-inducible protein OsmY [Simiduia aestuariiviva]